MYGRPVHQFEDSPDDPAPDNESLEHLGDSVLNFITTTLIRDMYPYIHVGPATKIRGMVVKNNNLAFLSLGYKMSDLLRGHHSQIVALRNSPNIQADVFEAYVGGLYLTQGLEATKSWLSTLFRPFIVNAYNAVRAEYYPSIITTTAPTPVDTSSPLSKELSEAVPSIQDISDAMEGMNINASNSRTAVDSTATNSITSITTTVPPQSPSNQIPTGHLMLFNEYAVKNKLTITWVWDRSNHGNGEVGTFWEARAFLGDECVGIGKARNKQVAKHEAASEALKKLGI